MENIKKSFFIKNLFFFLTIIFLFLSLFIKFIEKKNYNIVYETTNINSFNNYENFENNTLFFKNSPNEKISKVFIEFKGNLFSITAYYSDFIKIFDGNKLVREINNNTSLRTGFYETSFKTPLDINQLKIKFEGKKFEISKIILFETESTVKISLIDQIFNQNNIFELSYIFQSLVIWLYFIFFFFIIRLISKKIFKNSIDAMYIIPTCIIVPIFLNFLNVLIQNLILYFNLIFVLLLFLNLEKFKIYLIKNKKFFILLFLIFLTTQIPIIFRDFSFNYFGVIKSYNYSNIPLMVNGDFFLGYHFDSNLIWITSKVFQNLHNFTSAPQIFEQNSLDVLSITSRPIIIHQFFSYFFELFDTNSHFFYVRLQYFILSLTFVLLFKICRDKLNYSQSLLIILCLTFSSTIYFYPFHLEMINKVYSFIFFVASFYFFEKKKFNSSLFLILFGGLLHITGVYYTSIYIFLFILLKNYDLKLFLKYILVLFFVIYFHFNYHIWIAYIFELQILDNLYTSKLLSSSIVIEDLVKIKLLNFLNCFIPYFSESGIVEQKIPINKTYFYCLFSLCIFYFYKFPKERFVDFFINRLFIISPIILYIIVLNSFSKGGYNFFYIFSLFYTLLYFFILSDDFNKYFKFIIFSFFSFQAYLNIKFYYKEVFLSFYSKENYVFFIIFILFYIFIFSYFVKLIKNLKKINTI